MKKSKDISFSITWRITCIVFICYICSMILTGSLFLLFLHFEAHIVKFGFPIVVFTTLASSTLIGTAFSYTITKKMVKKIDAFKESMNAISQGDFSKKIPLPNEDTFLYSTCLEFNKMVDELNSIVVLRNDFTSNFSHEFKTPIVSIKGYAELLYNEKNLSEEDKMKYLKIIIDESKRLSSLATSTLTLSNLESQSLLEHKEEFSIDKQIEECILLLDEQCREKNITVDVSLEKFKYTSNKDTMKEVWINLLNNAIKFSPPKSTITISSYYSEKNYIVSIKDEGIGMSQETVKHIFDKYYQGDSSRLNQGTGLGLPIVKRILELSNARIEVNSIENEGSYFNVYFDIN